MSYLLGFNLSPLAIKIITNLFVYRGMTARQIAGILHPFGYTLSEEKSVYNYLSKLKKQKLVVSTRLRDGFSKGSIYYLSQKGYEFSKHWLNVQEGQQGNGWIYNDGGYQRFADIPYETYKPPLEQTAHHLLMIDFFIRFESLRKHGFEEFDHRINLYASENYENDENNFKFRPDAEIRLTNEDYFTIEIDRATESHEQLRKKFKTYRNYFDYLQKNDFGNLPKGILFVLEEKSRDHGMKRRWQSVATAFLQEIGRYHEKVNLIMTSMDKIEDTIMFEYRRQEYENQVREKTKSILKNKHYDDFKVYTHRENKNICFALALEKDSYDVFYLAYSHQFETSIYSRYIITRQTMHEISKQIPSMGGRKYNDSEIFLFAVGDLPVLIKEYNFDDPFLTRAINDILFNTNLFQLEKL